METKCPICGAPLADGNSSPLYGQRNRQVEKGNLPIDS